ncbi:MAG: hypothetical protein U9P49_03585 [Thermodesulfobacteriota bacterium]|nr:hypothetical protein [Thermodesulfobacteriota bacterium]
MKNFWAKLILLAIVAFAFTLPAWAVELKLSGSYEMQGRYYVESDIVHAKRFGAAASIGSQMEAITKDAATTAYGNLSSLTPSAGANLEVALYGPNSPSIDGYLTAAELTALGAPYSALAPLVTGDPLNYYATQAYIDSKITAATTLDPIMPNGDITDTEDYDRYLKHYFTIDPKLIITDRISISANIVAYENKLDWDKYGRYDKGSGDRLYDEYDRYNIFRIDNLWADIVTDYGMFTLGKTASFLGIGYFIPLGRVTPSLDKWTLGLIWHKDDEDGGNWNDGTTNSDDIDTDAFIAMGIYNTPALSFTGSLTYAYTGSDGGGGQSYKPTVKLTYRQDALTLNAFARYATGVFADKDDGSLVAKAAQLAGLTLLGPPYSDLLVGGKFKDDWEYGGYSGYVEASYDLSDVADVNLTPRLTLAYASGADEPTKVSGYFDDSMDFGTWLMNDVSDTYSMYFETPVSNNFDALGDPDMDDYSFSNIMLVSLGADLQVSEKLGLTGNIIWAKKANTDYLENWDPTNYLLNAINQDLTKLGTPFGPTTKNKVDDGLGWEINAKATYQVQDNLSVALQAGYYAPGDFYESAFEKDFGNTPTGTGLEIENEYAARWFATVTF